MGVFPLASPSTDVENVNMISTTVHNHRSKDIVESTSLGPYEALYDVIQFASDVHSKDIHLVDSDP